MPKVVAAFFILLCSGSIAFGQSSPLLRLSNLKGTISLDDYPFWRTTPVASTPRDTLDMATFGSIGRQRISGRDSVYWCRFDLLNDTPVAQRWVFVSPTRNDVVQFYIWGDSLNTRQVKRIGQHVSYWEAAYRYTSYALPVELAPAQRLSLLLKIENRYNPLPDPAIRLMTEHSLIRTFWMDYSSSFNGFYISVFILGAVLAMFFFMAFLYITTRTSLYLYYSLYLGGMSLYFTMKSDSLFFLSYWVHGFPKAMTLLNEPIQMIYMSLYFKFSMGLLRIQESDPRLYRFLQVFWKVLIVYALVMMGVAGLIWHREFDLALLTIDRIVLLLMSLVMLGRILQKNRSPLLPYFLVGNLFFISGMLLSTMLSLGMIDRGFSGFFSTINFFQMGVLGEIMCFSFALGYNVRLLNDERNANQKAYITQLRLNHEITENANKDLTGRLDERTNEVMAMSAALQTEKEAHLRSEFEFQLGEMEMQALRAQMNPHFIFNSLNTIRYFVLNNENEKASDYLGKFARLLRMVLQNSRENTISLSEELQALRLYLEIESERFGDSFHYTISVPPGLNTDEITVPPLLLQPFVENAIWHGLLHSPNSDKQLTVQILARKNHYLFLIEDNGIGRERAREIKSQSTNVKKSFGIQITNKRVELFNKKFSSQIQILIRDVVRPDGETGGTCVEIHYHYFH